jgi:hypothetical protein
MDEKFMELDICDLVDRPTWPKFFMKEADISSDTSTFKHLAQKNTRP